MKRFGIGLVLIIIFLLIVPGCFHDYPITILHCGKLIHLDRSGGEVEFIDGVRYNLDIRKLRLPEVLDYQEDYSLCVVGDGYIWLWETGKMNLLRQMARGL